MLRIQLEEDRPGYAKFTATKWSGSTEVEMQYSEIRMAAILMVMILHGIQNQYGIRWRD